MRIIVRGVLHLSDTSGDDSAQRTPLHGTAGQIRADLQRLAEQGADEVFIDCNFDTEIAGTDLDPDTSMTRALRLLDTFAPAG